MSCRKSLGHYKGADMKSITLLTLIATFSFAVTVYADERNVREYLDLLASRISKQPPPTSADEWNKSNKARRRKLMRMLGLDPLPKRTPLNPRYVGEPVELEGCTFRRVVLESAPGIFVAAHLYIPKGVKIPAPAVVYVPGHSRRDGYLRHSLAYGSLGYVTIGLPMVGEEGKIDDGCGKCGHYGPYYGNFHWYSTGYNPAGAEVWDTMRAVDFLNDLKSPNGKPLVDVNRIGIAGLSGGSARTFWSFAVDQRLKAAVACQGFTTVHKYNATIQSTCDVHLFYNYYQQPYGELYSVAAPRALRVVQATEDTLYNNPQPVADWMSALYRTIGKPDNFSYVTFSGRHGYTSKVIASEHEWLAQKLTPDRPKLPEVSDQERRQFKANVDYLGDRKNLQCFTGSRTEGWKLKGEPVKAESVQAQFTPTTPAHTIRSRDEFNNLKAELTAALREEVLPTAFALPKVKLQLGSAKAIEGFQQEDGTLIVDSTLRHRCTLINAPKASSRMIVLLTDETIEKLAFPARTVAGLGFNVFILETTRLTNRHLRRHAALVGHTPTSLHVNDALAAYKALSRQRKKQSKTIYLMGKSGQAVAAIYAAAVEPAIAGVILDHCPDRHDSETALLGVLRYGDVPTFAGLLYPRPVIKWGKQGRGFEWTANLYKSLGSEAAFQVADETGVTVIAKLP